MPKDDYLLTIPEYWDKYKYEIADFRAWSCDKDECKHATARCTKQCRNWLDRQELCSTLLNYDRHIERLSQYLTTPISEVSLFQIRDALECVRDSRKGGKQYADSTIDGHYSCLHDILMYAQKQGDANDVLAPFSTAKGGNGLFKAILKIANPARGSSAILSDLKELREQFGDQKRSLTNWQREKLMHLVCDDILIDGRSLGVALICYAGTRPAEDRKLLWGDVIPFIDHEGRNYCKMHGIRSKSGVIQERMKTRNGYRKVPVHCELEKLLLKRKMFLHDNCTDEYLSYPISCYQNEYDQPCMDFQLANYASKLFKNIRLTNKDIERYFIDYSIEKFEEDTNGDSADEPLYLYVLRKNFWTWMEAETQLTDYEKRYVMGHEIIANGQNLRDDMNDENLLWEISRKMDNFIFCRDLHEEFFDHELPAGGCIRLDNCGIARFHISPEIFKRGGKIEIVCQTEECNDTVFLDFLKNALLLKNYQYYTASIPDSRTHTGINTQYDNYFAHGIRSPTKQPKENE